MASPLDKYLRKIGEDGKYRPLDFIRAEKIWKRDSGTSLNKLDFDREVEKVKKQWQRIV